MAEDEQQPQFKVKELVEVAARTHPGFNFQGGTARISKVRDERVEDGGPMKDGSESRTTGYTYDVKYVIGGSERRVDAQHITSKVLATRQELGEQRQEEAQRKKIERERAEAEARRLEAERAERKRMARAELAKRREAKAAKKPAQKRRKVLPVVDEKTAVDAEPTTTQDDTPPEPARAESDEIRWLRDILIDRVPRTDAPDELALEDVVATVLAASDAPPALAEAVGCKRDVVTSLLSQLDAANFIMFVDATIFLV
ncbi:hypothetical protein CTAYLR_010773 [Chrysophaeum taylorii]|uniref:Uncharacterized protein n=1 Tax=Chrysophaeum taylorii TaxID=2483200 RepID=A0AAD7XP35_9STRA|nr:hypothetical protein CTAYLR_010773 [Chrysophaeum taylorii]